MKTACKHCIHNIWDKDDSGNYIQIGCRVNRLEKFTKNLTQDEYNSSYYILDGFCNLCMDEPTAEKLGIETSEDAMNLIKVNPWAFVIINKDNQLSESVLDDIKNYGFNKICLIYIGVDADYTLVIDYLPKNYKEFKVVWLERDESIDFAVDQAFEKTNPHSYVTIIANEQLPSLYLDKLNQRLVDGERILMVDSGEAVTGFWILGILHKVHRGNMPNDNGNYLAEKIRKTSEIDNQSHLIVKLENL